MENKIVVLKRTELLGHQFSVYGTAENPLFLAKEVAKVIEHSDISTMVRMVDEDEKLRDTNPNNVCGGQTSWFLTEDGLYEVLMQSRKPIAKQFKKCVKEILKEIRKTGGYIATAPDDTPEIIMAKAIKIADMKIKQQSMLIEMQKQQINEQIAELQIEKPLADYTRDVLQSDTTYTLTQVAKDLGFRSIYAFEKWAVENKILYYQSKQWIPTAKYSEKGYFTTRTAKYVKSDGTVGSSMSTVVTEKGRLFLHEYTKKPEGHIKSGYEEEYPLLAKVLSEN